MKSKQITREMLDAVANSIKTGTPAEWNLAFARIARIFGVSVARLEAAYDRDFSAWAASRGYCD